MPRERAIMSGSNAEAQLVEPRLKLRDSQGAVPVVRVASFLRYVGYLQAVGAPVGRLLAGARIPAMLLEHPAAVVPQKSAFRFGELACQALGTEHLGVYVGLAHRLDDLGPYGQKLQAALTVHEYLRTGIVLYNMLITGQQLWLSEDQEGLRFNVTAVGEPGIAAYQSQMETLVVTIGKLRDAAGAGWSPREISLAYRTREDLPDIDLFAGSRISRGTGETYFTIPWGLMGMRLPKASSPIPTSDPRSPAKRPLPKDLPGLVQIQIESLLCGRDFQIETVAETLAMSVRTLQRRLADQGLTYSQVLDETRLRRAADWLENTDDPVAQIAFELGYTDASNFTRAFRRHTGLSPQAFRDTARVT
jgi:AraC-like DNA-binding protein